MPQHAGRFFQDGDRIGRPDELGGLRQAAAGQPDAELTAAGQLGQRRDRIREVHRIAKVLHDDGGAQLDPHARRQGREDDKRVPRAEIVCDPDLADAPALRGLAERGEIRGCVAVDRRRKVKLNTELERRAHGAGASGALRTSPS